MKTLRKFFTGLIVLLVFCGTALATDVNLPPAVEKALESRVLIKIFPQDAPNQEISGTGFVAAPGYIGTCYHLVYAFLGFFPKEELVIQVRKNPNEEPVLAEIFFINYRNDFLLLKVKDSAKLGPPVRFAETFLPDGAAVYASGFWLEGKFKTTFKTVVLGRVNDFPYNGLVIEEAVIIDREILPGFSGGPVFNEKGELVGMNLATGSGIGAILPLDFIKKNLKEALKDAAK